VWLDDTVLAPVRARYGEPATLELELEVSQQERELIRESAASRGRHHDVTFFVFAGKRLALIRKPHYAPGLWRPPGGGLRPGEDFGEGVRREALEELGIAIELQRYLVRVSATFTHAGDRIPWQTHVLEASTTSEGLAPVDTVEISAARWGTLAELQGPIRVLLLATDRPLWRYRVALHDAAARALEGL
jgi:8-oxo-dGTP pyrophosphatase MutT (NUDIX family)